MTLADRALEVAYVAALATAIWSADGPFLRWLVGVN